MRAVVQRVTWAQVIVANEVVGKIDRGLLVLLGVAGSDTKNDAVYIASKLGCLRIFEDHDGKMNLTLADVGGQVLVVSQFTLLGDCRKGRRPSFAAAARPELANELYQNVVDELRKQGFIVETGQFQEHMEVSLVNDGPVTILVDSTRHF